MRLRRTRLVWVLAIAATISAAAAFSATRGWTSHAPLPVPRTEVAAAVRGGEIVVVGGFLASGANSRRADAFRPSTGRWRRLDDLPVTVDHAAAASWRGLVVVAGGYGADRRPLRTAFAFDGVRWQRLPLLPEARAAAAAAATADGRIWVVGGRTPTGLAKTALVLDLRTRRWRSVQGPTPREHLAATALRGQVYAIGGRLAGYDTNVATVESLDPATGRWSARPDLPEPRGGTGAAALAGRIVSAGSESPAGTSAAVWSFRPGASAWVALPPLPTPRHGLGVVAHSGRVWVVAGGPEPGLTVSGVLEALGLP